MNKKSTIIIIILLFVTLTISGLILTNINTNKPTLSAGVTYTKKELQDYIVSTAVSYYYNNKYTDYNGYWADESHSDYSTTYVLSPEMVSRSRYMVSQCEAFATTCYMQALGFDFVKYKSSFPKGKYTSYVNSSGERLYVSNDDAVFKNAYKYFSKIYSVEYMNRIARENRNDPMVVLTYQKGKISTIEGVSDTSKTVTELLTGSNGENILNKIVSKLEPGDILLNDGHAMVWVGDIFEPSGGAIHSSAVSLKMARDENSNITSYSNGYDAFDIKYSSADYIFRRGIIYHNAKTNDVITILRPINSMCTFKDGVCTLDGNYAKVLSNTQARNKLNRLRVEEFIYDKTGDRTLGSDSSSVNENDEVTYYIYLTNKSNFSFCSSGTKENESDCTSTGVCSNATYTTKETCESNNYKWEYNRWISIKKNVNYNNITITSTIPKGTEYVRCSKSCKYSNGKVTWSNINIASSNEFENKYGFTVKVKEGTNVLDFDGMTLTYDNSVLKMGSYKTYVNSTINGKYAEDFKNIINSDINSNKSCSSSKEYIAGTYNKFISLDNIEASNSINLSNVITGNNIVNGIFKELNFDNITSYTKKTSDEVSKLTGNNKIINDILVPSFYGGYRYNKLFYDNNMGYFNKIKPDWHSRINLNVGDVIVTLKKNGNNFELKNIMMYDGMLDSVPTFVYCENNKVIRHRIREFASSDPRSKFYANWYGNNLLLYELYSSDLYAVLRPSKYLNLKYKESVQENVNQGNNSNNEPVNEEPVGESDNNNQNNSSNNESVSENPSVTSSDNTQNVVNNNENLEEKEIVLKEDDESTINKVYYDEDKGWLNDKKETINSIEVPTKENLTFEGYYTEKEGNGVMVIDKKGNIVENKETLKEDTTLYGYWVVSDDVISNEEETINNTELEDDNIKDNIFNKYKYVIYILLSVIVIFIIIVIVKKHKNNI